jgi:hypothetical protein
LENNHVRVWTLELRPNEKTNLVARDHDFLQVPLDEGWLSISIEGRQPVPFSVEKKARFVRGGFSQTIQSRETRTLRLVEVEFIQNVGAERCGPEAEVPCGCLGSSTVVRIFSCGVLETDDFAVNQLENHDGDRVGLSVVPTLVVAVDPVRIQPMAVPESAGLLLEPGQIMWVEEEGRSIQSGDRSIAKAVTIEFKKPQILNESRTTRNSMDESWSDPANRYGSLRAEIKFAGNVVNRELIPRNTA